MALEATIGKKHAFVFLGLVVLIAGLFVATAYGTNDPPVFGHTPSETDPGATWSDPVTGSATFGGTSNMWYWFRGHLGVGQNTAGPNGAISGDRDIHIKSETVNAGIGIESTGTTGDTYIDFLQSGAVKSNINYKSDRLQINVHSGATNTDTVISGRNVGIGMNPISEKLEVNGRVKANGFCIDTDCRTSWSGSGAVTVDNLPIGAWCGRSWFGSGGISTGIKCGTSWPNALNGCPSNFAQTIVDTNGQSQDIYVCIKNA
ncbi:MAG: hypothetical protein AABY02_02760 [Nanoarchaeota archaeon]